MLLVLLGGFEGQSAEGPAEGADVEPEDIGGEFAQQSLAAGLQHRLAQVGVRQEFIQGRVETGVEELRGQLHQGPVVGAQHVALHQRPEVGGEVEHIVAPFGLGHRLGAEVVQAHPHRREAGRLGERGGLGPVGGAAPGAGHQMRLVPGGEVFQALPGGAVGVFVERSPTADAGLDHQVEEVQPHPADQDVLARGQRVVVHLGGDRGRLVVQPELLGHLGEVLAGFVQSGRDVTEREHDLIDAQPIS